MAKLNTQQLDALLHDNNKCEIRFDPMVQYTNCRLTNLGCTITLSAGEIEKVAYLSVCGAQSLIKNIYLMDGANVLDQCFECKKWHSFNKLRQGGNMNDNGLDFSLNSWLDGGCRSYQCDASTGNKILNLVAGNGTLATTDSDTTHKSWVSLASLLDFVGKVGVLDTNLFKNLRLIIEWETDPDHLFQGDVSTVALVNVLRPTLVCDVVQGMPMPQTVVFTRYEIEKVVLQNEPNLEAPNKTSKTTNIRSLAFNGHRILNLLFQNYEDIYEESSADRVKDQSSSSAPNEKIQLSLNGRTVLQYNGIDSSARKLAMCLQTFGDINVPTGSAIYCPIVEDDEWVDSFYVNPYDAVFNKFSFFGVNLQGERVEELMIEHSRDLIPPSFNNVYQLNLIAQVPMVLSVGKGEYVVSYA